MDVPPTVKEYVYVRVQEMEVPGQAPLGGSYTGRHLHEVAWAPCQTALQKRPLLALFATLVAPQVDHHQRSGRHVRVLAARHRVAGAGSCLLRLFQALWREISSQASLRAGPASAPAYDAQFGSGGFRRSLTPRMQ